jgi:hypothetical protein
VKCHEFVPQLRALGTAFFLTKRDLRDVAASAVRRGMIAHDQCDVIAFLRNEIIALEKWQKLATFEIAYEDLIAKKAECTQILASHLNLQVDVQSVHDQVTNLRIGTEYDRTTKLWPNHITDGRVGSFRNTLSAPVITRIENEFQRWLRSNNYRTGV